MNSFIALILFIMLTYTEASASDLSTIDESSNGRNDEVESIKGHKSVLNEDFTGQKAGQSKMIAYTTTANPTTEEVSCCGDRETIDNNFGLAVNLVSHQKLNPAKNEDLTEVMPIIHHNAKEIHANALSDVSSVIATGKKLAKFLTTKLAAPKVVKYSKTAAIAAALPAALAAKGAFVGKMIAKPIVLKVTALAGLHAAKKAAIVGVPVAIGTGIAAGATWVRGKLKSLAKSGVSSLLPLALQNLPVDKTQFVVKEKEIAPKLPLITTTPPPKNLNDYFRYDASPVVESISVSKSLNIGKARTKRSVKQPVLDMDVAMRLLKMAEIEDCIGRVICELGCDVKNYGDNGMIVFRNLLDLQMSGQVKRKEFDFYRNALLDGRKLSRSKKCEVCQEKYPKCKALTEDLLTVASLVKLE